MRGFRRGPEARKRDRQERRSTKTRRRKRTIPASTSAAIVVARPKEAIQVQQPSALPQIMQTVENLERVRRFVSRCLNTDLQRALAKLAKEKLSPEDRAKKELALRDKLEIDWGTIPGVDKPFLKQPGAEKFLFWLNLRPRFTKRERELGDGHMEIVACVTVFSKKTGEEVFEGPDCSCTTMESNFRFRWSEAEVTPPKDEVERMKARGMGKFRKKTEWAHGKRVGDTWVWLVRVENPNIHDERNKVRQIGEKRALVKCVKNMGAISEIFTADPSEWDIPEADEGSPYDDQDYTEGGRRILDENGVSPSGRYQAPAAQRPQSPAPDSEQPRPVKKPEPPKPKERRKIVLTWNPTDKGVAYLSGDLAQILEVIQKACICQWLDQKKTYAIPSGEAQTVAEIAEKNDYEYVEMTLPVSAPPPPQQAKSAEPAVIPLSGGASPQSATAAGPTQLSGIIRSTDIGTTKTQHVPKADVNINGTVYRTYVKPLFEYFANGKDKEAEVLLDGKKQIVGIVRIGTRQFDADGRTPIIDINEPRGGTKELFQQ